MYLRTGKDGVQVLSFDTDKEARLVGQHLLEMSPGHRHYARGGDDADPGCLLAELKLAAADTAAREGGSPPAPPASRPLREDRQP